MSVRAAVAGATTASRTGTTGATTDQRLPSGRASEATTARTTAATSRSDNRSDRAARATADDRNDRGEPTTGEGERRPTGATAASDNRDRRSDNRTGHAGATTRTDGGSRYDNRGTAAGTRGNDGDDDERGGRRRNRQRSRDRKRGGARREGEGFSGGYAATSPRPSTTTTCSSRSPASSTSWTTTRSSAPRGYLPGANDVYVPLGIVKKNGLRKGDAVTGAVKALREGEQPPSARQKFNALVRLDTVNGMTPEEAAQAGRVRQADAALPPGAAAPGDRAQHPHDADHRPRRPDRQGPARPHRRPGQGRQDDDHAGHRQRDHDEQPRVPPHGRPRRRASRGGHRHAARGQGRGHRLDLRPAGRGPHDRRRARHRAGQAPGRARPRRRRAARLDHQAGSRLQPRRPGERAHPVRWCRLGRALPAEEVLRRRAQHRERWLAHHPRDGAGRDRARRWTR